MLASRRGDESAVGSAFVLRADADEPPVAPVWEGSAAM